MKTWSIPLMRDMPQFIRVDVEADTEEEAVAKAIGMATYWNSADGWQDCYNGYCECELDTEDDIEVYDD